MNSRELWQVLIAAGCDCQLQRDEVVVAICTFCGNDRFNLQLSADKGVYHCWACKRGGRLDTLLTTLTGQPHHIPTQLRERSSAHARPAAPAPFKSAPPMEIPSAARYLELRGLPAREASAYGVVVCLEEGHRLCGRIAVPMKDFWTGELHGWVGRSYTNQVPKYLSTMPRKAITGWRVRDPHAPAVLVEGPFDGITAHRAGLQVAVLSGTGDAGVVEWASRLPPQTVVAVMLDGDALVQAHRLLWQIQPVRPAAPCVLVPLGSEEDPDSLGVQGVEERVRSAVRAGAPT